MAVAGCMRGAVDSLLLTQTPEGIEYAVSPAGITVRACAWGIDCLIKCIALFVPLAAAALINEVLGIWFFFLLNFAVNWFYFTLFEIFLNGQTPGKRLMGLRVVCGDGSPVKAGASFLRNLLRFADGFFYLYLIAFVSMAASPGFRRFGDWAADTLVVYTERSWARTRIAPPSAFGGRETIPHLAGFKSVIPKTRLGYEEKQALLMFARRYPLLGKGRADDIARPWALELRKRESAETEGLSDSAYLLGIARAVSGIL